MIWQLLLPPVTFAAGFMYDGVLRGTVHTQHRMGEMHDKFSLSLRQAGDFMQNAADGDILLLIDVLVG